jgi:hypothetical protein
MVVHVDNAPVHHSKTAQNCLEHSTLPKFLCPLHLGHIFLLDFYLLEKRKSALMGQQIPDEINLLEIVTRISDVISMKNCRLSFAVGLNLSKTSLTQMKTIYPSEYFD